MGEAAAQANVFVALYGPLGAGKTRLTQAACAGAGVTEDVTSPTYTLVHWYRGDRGPVAHADLYRIEGEHELLAIGWEDLESGSCPVFVEWAERGGSSLPPDRWDVRLEVGDDPLTRRVSIEPVGAAPQAPTPESIEVDAC